MVGHVEPKAGAVRGWSQQLKYGERTARGIAEGKKACCALTRWERRRAKSGKRIMIRRDTVRDFAFLDAGNIKSKKIEGMITRRV